jgi:hypothetical protein
MYRLPVRFKGKPLMPMKATRVKKFIESSQGKIRYDRKLKVHYLQLLVSPSGIDTQDIVIGFDPGSTYDGISVVSPNYHHINIELIQRPKKGKNAISSFKKRQASNRRGRRCRLRHRRIRFSNRTSSKLTPTIRANVEFRQWLISKLIKIYPISKIVVEDVRFNHYNCTEGRAFSLVEQGKTKLYQFIKSLGLSLELVDGFNTKNLRVRSFGYDSKVREKDRQVFEAHCIDSFVLACPRYDIPNMITGEVSDYFKIDFKGIVNKSIIFIEKIVKIRRCLTTTRKLYTSKNNLIGPQYYRKLKGGIKEPYSNVSNKPNICRVKPEGIHSNHPKKWIYINNGKVEKFKCNTAHYGGTRLNGKSFFKNGEWENRKLWMIS